MLKEKCYFREELPISVNTVHIEEYPPHFHDDLEIVYVLEWEKLEGSFLFCLNLLKALM